MSATQQSDDEIIVECDNCDTELPKRQTVGLARNDEYCDFDCLYTHKGQKALNQVESDHTICASCHKPIKSIEKPPQGTTVNIPPSDHKQSNGVTENVLIGFQYQTQHTERFDDASGTGNSSIYYTRWSCECGTVDPNERDDILEAVDLKETVTNLCDRLYELCEKDAIGGAFNHKRFLDAFEQEERNWGYAVGYGLYG